VVELVKKEFGLNITVSRRITRPDESNGRGLAQKWVELFQRNP
jgi:hypothetical protein